MKPVILLIEDDTWLLELYSDVLTGADYEVLSAKNANEALDLLGEDHTISLIVLDMFLPSHNGIEFLHEIASYSDSNQLPVIVLSSVYQHDFAMNEERWKHYGVVEYLYKPTTKPKDFLVAVKKQLVKAVAS